MRLLYYVYYMTYSVGELKDFFLNTLILSENSIWSFLLNTTTDKISKLY